MYYRITSRRGAGRSAKPEPAADADDADDADDAGVVHDAQRDHAHRAARRRHEAAEVEPVAWRQDVDEGRRQGVRVPAVGSQRDLAAARTGAEAGGGRGAVAIRAVCDPCARAEAGTRKAASAACRVAPTRVAPACACAVRCRAGLSESTARAVAAQPAAADLAPSTIQYEREREDPLGRDRPCLS